MAAAAEDANIIIMCGCKDCQGITLLKGTDGNGIVSITDNGDGTLTILYTNGTVYITPNLTGPQGEQGIQGDPGTNGIGFDSITWIEMPLINGWVAASVEDTPYYAVVANMLFLKGLIIHNTFDPFKDIFWETAPITTRPIILMVWDQVAPSAVQVTILDGTEEMMYNGPWNPTLRLSLDSLPIIRLY